MKKKRKEVWHNIPGLNRNYQVSNRGRVRSLGYWVEYEMYGKEYNRYISSRILKSRVDQYSCVSIDKKMWQVSHLVLMADGRPRPSPEHVADHINWDITDNRPRNLRWLTQSENVRHRKNPVVTHELAAHIKHLNGLGHTSKAIAEHLGLKSTVGSINRGRTWTDINAEDYSENFGEII